MTVLRRFRTITMLTLPVGLLAACGDGDSATLATQERMTLSTLSMTGELYVGHPTHLEFEADLHGVEFTADILLGLRTVDGAEGCVLGSARIEHGEEGDEPLFVERDLVVRDECLELAGRDDLVPFVSFDPWDTLGDRGAEPPRAGERGRYPDYAQVEPSILACEACDARVTLQEFPGQDAQLLAVDLSSVVAVIDGGTVRGARAPDFDVSSGFRVKGATVEDPARVKLRHRIRPSRGAADLNAVADGAGDWMPLYELAGEVFTERRAIDVAGPHDVSHIAGLYLEGDTRARVVDGAWREIEEFELQTCVEPDFEQAVYGEESDPRADDCAVLPVVVVRDAGLEGQGTRSATLREAKVYAKTWAASAPVLGSASLDLSAWADINGAQGSAHTFGGFALPAGGVWVEAGVSSNASVFGSALTILDTVASAQAHNSTGDGTVVLGFEAFNYELIPTTYLSIDNGATLTLQEVFDEAQVDLDPSFGYSQVIAGISLMDGLDASISLVGTVSIDTEATDLTPSLGANGAVLASNIVPNLAVELSGSLGFDVFVMAASIDASLTLLNLAVPYTATIELVGNALSVTETVVAELSTLAGEITWSAAALGDLWSDGGTIAQWDGIEVASFPLFSSGSSDLATIDPTNFVAPAPGWCEASDLRLHRGDVNGDGEDDFICHRPVDGVTWIDYGPTYSDHDWYNPTGWCKGAGQELYVGDFDGDGRSDLLCYVASTGVPWVDLADVNGQFDREAQTSGVSWCSANDALRVGDFNGDGRFDLLCHNLDTGHRWIDLADDDGMFNGTDEQSTSAPWCSRWGNQEVEVHVGDFNGDGRDDIMCVDLFTNQKHIDYVGQGGEMGLTDWTMTDGWCWNGGVFSVGDYNGDGLADMRCDEWYNNTDWTWIQTANAWEPRFNPGVAWNGPNPGRFYAGNPCGEVSQWYNDAPPTPVWDGTRCSVSSIIVPDGQGTFISAGSWYMSAGPGNTCSVGTFDSVYCKIGTPPVGTTASFHAGYATYALD